MALSVLGLFYFIYFMQSGEEKGTVASDFLPPDVLFYGEQLDFTASYHEFLDSRLGRTLKRLDYRGIASDLGSPEQNIQEVERLWTKVNEVINDPGFDEILGKQFSVAIFPAKSFATVNPAKAIEERLLLIAKPRHQAETLTLLAPVFIRDVEQKKLQYGSHTITRYKLSEKDSLSTATVAGLVLAGFDERLVRKGLDCYDERGTKESLSDNVEFKKLRGSFASANIFAYLSLPALYEQGQMIAGHLPERDRAEFLRLLEHWQGWGAAAYGAWRQEGLVRDRVEIRFNREKLDSHIAGFFEVKPAENKTLAMVPDDTLFYYWTNTLNLQLLWKLYVLNGADQQPEALEILRHELRDSVGVELEELLAMIDSEFALIVKDVDQEGIPLPKVGGLVQLKDPEAFLAIFNKLLEEADIPTSQKKYKGHEITYWGIAPQHGLQPAFCRFGNYLLISNSIDLVKQVGVLVNGSGKSLLQGETMVEVGAELNKKNNSATYIHIARLADSLKGLAIWAKSMAVLQGPQAALEAEVYVHHILLPLLDGIAMYTQLGSRSFITDDSIVLESTINVVQ
ncbi:MAG: DUF3352 domain-containing protein [Thermodesulfobacteriota bacterium]